MSRPNTISLRAGKDDRRMTDTEAAVTPAVLAAMANTADSRLREIMASFVRHLHDFAREVRLSEGEFEQGITFLNRIGQATNDQHNEGVLFGDIVGLSTLVCLLNNSDAGATETAAALLGPFWRLDQPRTANGGSIVRSATPGPALFARVHVVDPHGAPIAGVDVDVWHASPVGMYDIQDENQAAMNLRGKFTTDAEGCFWFRSVKPAGYPIPTHGPSGDLLCAQLRHPQRPAHLHFLCYKTGYKTLISQVFVGDDPHLETDVVFGVTAPLVGAYVARTDPPPEPGVAMPWYSLDHRLVMEPGEATLPVPAVK
jgi:catechol 1,2-dioxygenase